MNYSTMVVLLGIPIIGALLLRLFARKRDNTGAFKDARTGTAAAIALAFLALAILHYLSKLEEPPHDPYLRQLPVYKGYKKQLRASVRRSLLTNN